jgi:hypothetical protein
VNTLPIAAITCLSGAATGYALARNSGRIKDVVETKVRTSAEYVGFLAYMTAMNRRIPSSEDRQFASAACRSAEYGWPGLYDLRRIDEQEERGEPVLAGQGMR